MHRLLLINLVALVFCLDCPAHEVINRSEHTVYVKPAGLNKVVSIAPGTAASWNVEYLAAPFWRSKGIYATSTSTPDRIIIPEPNKAKTAQKHLNGLTWLDQKWCIERLRDLKPVRKNKSLYIIAHLAWLAEEQKDDQLARLPVSWNTKLRKWLKQWLTWGTGKIINESPFQVLVKKENSANVVLLPPGETYTGNYDALAIPQKYERKIFKALDTVNIRISQNGEAKAYTNPMLKQLQYFFGGWRDANWLNDQHKLHIFIWDPLYDAISGFLANEGEYSAHQARTLSGSRGR